MICGGESGPRARPCDVAWIRSAVEQCSEAGVPVFVKQLGARVHHPDGDYRTWGFGEGVRFAGTGGDRIGVILDDRKGGDWSEWPEDLRVREYPR